MTDIIEAIDAWTLDRYGSQYTTKLWGFCELMRKTAGEGGEEIFPVTISGRNRVSIKDNYNFITWMRWQQPATNEFNEDWSFGRSEARVSTIPIRFVLAHKSSHGENVVFDLVNAFPSKFDVSGYQFVFTSANFSVDPDHEAIVQAELGPANYMAYEKHRVTWNVYALTINIQAMMCPVTSD